MYKKRFGETIKRLRKEHPSKFSVRGLAKEADISATYLSKVERGEIPVSDSVLHRIAKCLDVCPKDLFLVAGRIPPTLVWFCADHANPIELIKGLEYLLCLSPEELKTVNTMLRALTQKEK